MKKINKSFPLIFITLIFVSLSMRAQNNVHSWEKIKNQYGNVGLRYIASEVEIAEVIDLKDPVFMSAPLKANVLLVRMSAAGRPLSSDVPLKLP